MATIEKGAPSGIAARAQTDHGMLARELVEAAFADKGAWYSAEQPPDIAQGSIHSLVHRAVHRLVAEISTKDSRIWVRFYKDSDETE